MRHVEKQKERKTRRMRQALLHSRASKQQGREGEAHDGVMIQRKVVPGLEEYSKSIAVVEWSGGSLKRVRKEGHAYGGCGLRHLLTQRHEA